MYPNPYPNNQQGPPTGYPAPVPGYAPPQLPYQQPGYPPQYPQSAPQPYGSVPVPGYPQHPTSVPPLPYPVSPINQYPHNVGYPPAGPPRPEIGFANTTPQSVYPNPVGPGYPGSVPPVYNQPLTSDPSRPPHGTNFAQPSTQIGASSYSLTSSQAYNVSASVPSATAGHVSNTRMATLQQYQETPTIRDAYFDPNLDAQALRKAMKGFGTDETALINVLAKRTNGQRLQIANTYKSCFGKDLVKDLKSETSGKFEDVLVNLMTPRFDYIAQRLHDAMAGIGTKEMVLIDVLCTSSNQELQWIQAAYHRIYQKPLEKDIMEDTSGHFRRILVSMCAAQRNEDIRVDPSAVTHDANELYNAGMKKWGTDESVFNMIIASRSYQHLREVFHEYERISGQDIERTINAEFSGDIKDAMNAVVKCVKNRASYFAQRLRDAMAGLGTNDGVLIFLIITRAEIDLENIKQEYNRLYSRSLAQDISSETSGDYKKILITLLGM